MVINVQFVSFNSSLRSICMSPDQVLILKPPCRILQVRHFAQSNNWWTILPCRPLLRLIDHVLRKQSTSKFQSKPLWDTTNQIYLVHSSLYALCPHKECVLTVELCPWLINLNLLNFSILAFAYCKCFPKVGQSSVILNHNSLFFFYTLHLFHCGAQLGRECWGLLWLITSSIPMHLSQFALQIIPSFEFSLCFS